MSFFIQLPLLMTSIRSTLICIVSLFVAGSIASLYTFSNVNGGSWQTGSNWTPEGVPGAEDDVVFPYIDNVADSITLTIDGDVTVNSMTVEHFSFHFKSGSITIQNDCLFNAGTYKQMNITLLGNSTWLSTGGGNYVTCDGCVVNIKKSLALLSNGSGYTKIQTTAATFVNYAGATFTLGFGAMDATNGQYGTLINYGTLLFQTYTGTYPPTPYGFPIRAETGPWLEFRNYGDMRVDHIDTEVGSVVNSLVKYFNFLDGKLTLRIVQNSTANNGQGFDSDYEYNDVMASGGSYDYYEANINGDVHVIFAQASVADGQEARPFNPQPGDFFPVFGGFMKYTGKIRTLTVEGLSSGLTIGRKTIPDVNSSERSLNGIVICATSDTACINASGEVQTPTDASTPVAPGTNAPTRGTAPTTSMTSSASSLKLVFATVTMALTSLLF